jgi:TonB family protein
LACLPGVLCATAIAVTASQRATAPRLRQSAFPAMPIAARGGGEVVLDVEVDANGSVAGLTVLRSTPPYDEWLAGAVKSWSFEPATAAAGSGRQAARGRVLVAALMRPPSLYSGPTAGAPPQTRGRPSPDLPQPQGLTMPPYPPNAVGDAAVLVEIELTGRAEPREYRVLSSASGFDGAALDAVRTWRFTAPRSPDTPERVFVYAVLGFRAPLAH